MKVFLGGTCNGSMWRDELIPKLKIDYFNPVVENWTPDCRKRELLQRSTCDICLYTITPRMKGVYSIAEVIDDSNKRPDKTVLCILEKDGFEEFGSHQLTSLKAIGDMVMTNGGIVFYDLESLVRYLND